MRIPKYFIFRPVNEESWQVLQRRSCDDGLGIAVFSFLSGEYADWCGDDLHDALVECARLNGLKRGKL